MGWGGLKEERENRRVMSSCCCTAVFIGTLHLLLLNFMLLCMHKDAV